MPQVIKKENITISIGEYEKDGQTKQRYKTIGELVTMQGDDGSTYQFGEMWGPTGSTKFNVYEQQDRNATQSQAAESRIPTAARLSTTSTATGYAAASFSTRWKY